jgi:hypothetical protein
MYCVYPSFLTNLFYSIKCNVGGSWYSLAYTKRKNVVNMYAGLTKYRPSRRLRVFTNIKGFSGVPLVCVCVCARARAVKHLHSVATAYNRL